MTQDKQKRIFGALKFGALLLLVVLIAILAVILVEKSKLNAEIELMTQKCTELSRMISNNADIAEIRSQREWIEQYAREHGYMYEGDIKIGDKIIIIPEITE